MSTCQHGLPSADCLICKTLAGQGAVRSAPVATEAPRHRFRHRNAAPPLDRPPVEVVTRPQRGSLFSHPGLLVALAVGAAIAGWFVAGAVFALLRVLEIGVVALFSGWVGYRWGLARGRRHPTG